MHTLFYFFIFLLFIFYFIVFFFGLGWAKPSPTYILVAGLSAAPQGLGQPGPVTGPSQ